MKITYWGGGYVGLTGAVTFAREGHDVLIYDPDTAVVDAINNGTPKADEFLAYLGDATKTCIAAGKLHATADENEVWRNDVHILAVPSERDGVPYDTIVYEVVRNIYAHHGVAHHGVVNKPFATTVLVESTITPGRIDSILKSGVAVTDESGFCLAVCPRRDWFADANKNLETLDRVVGGVTPRCTSRAVEILSAVSKKLLPTDYRTAELTKPLENAILHLPVTLCHQLAWAYPDRNVAAAVKLASTHWRFASLGPLYIGAGVGGRCVPLGPQYLVHGANGGVSLAAESRDVDVDMRNQVAKAMSRHVGQQRKHFAVILGAGYRPEFKDAGLSPGVAIAQQLELDYNFTSAICDPFWTPEEIHAQFNLRSVANPQCADIVLLATPHKAFATWPERREFWHTNQVVLDAQGTWSAYREFFYREYGVWYFQIGTPGWFPNRIGKPAWQPESMP